MGTVQGVYMKYVALSAMGFTSAVSHMTDDWKFTARAYLMCYVGVVNGLVAVWQICSYYFIFLFFLTFLFVSTLIDYVSSSQGNVSSRKGFSFSFFLKI